jgi:hypothetical protein
MGPALIPASNDVRPTEASSYFNSSISKGSLIRLRSYFFLGGDTVTNCRFGEFEAPHAILGCGEFLESEATRVAPLLLFAS